MYIRYSVTVLRRNDSQRSTEWNALLDVFVQPLHDNPKYFEKKFLNQENSPVSFIYMLHIFF